MTKINIEYSIENEVERIMTILKDIDWFIKYGYSLEKLTFPKNLSLKEIEKITKDDVRKIITEEFNVSSYKENDNYLKEEWLKIEPQLSEKIKKLKISPEKQYTICFTKYGTGGSYHRPNLIFVNIARRWNIGILRTVIHEIIHLLIEDLIQKYKIKHWTKERIVDLIFLDFFPELSKMQTVPIETEEIDKIFHQNFPDVEKILLEINKL